MARGKNEKNGYKRLKVKMKKNEGNPKGFIFFPKKFINYSYR